MDRKDVLESYLNTAKIMSFWEVELSERCAKPNWDGKRVAGAKALVMSGLYGPTKVVP